MGSNAAVFSAPQPGELSPPISQRMFRLLLVYGLLCLLLPAAFIWLHLTTPSDGARLARTGPEYTLEGVVVSPYSTASSPLQEGDVVVAVDGIEIESMSRDLLTLNTNRPRWRVGQTVIYTVRREGETKDIALTLRPLPLRSILRDHWSVFVFFIVAQVLVTFVYFQRRDDPAARAFFIWAFSGSNAYTWSFFLQVSDLLYPVGFWLFHLAASGLWLSFWASVVHTSLMFPKPLFRLNRLRPWVYVLYVSPFLVFGIYLAWQWRVMPNILVWWGSWGVGQSLIAALYSLPGLIFIFWQYLTSRSEVERIKTRWVIFGTLISLGLGLGLYFIPSLLSLTPISANALGLVNFPFIISLSIAIWRYQLFDIDLVIRRTLSYTVLTGTLSLVYFSGVALMQTAVAAVGGRSSTVVIVLTTLAIAALFNPLRRRIQDFIDRRFYRQKYDAELALSEFAATARNETDLEALSAELVAVVQDTLQPEHIILMFTKTKNSLLRENK